MSKSQTLMKGTLILTLTGITTRCIGFFYRIFMSHTFGEEMVGIYQLIFPVYALFFSLTCAGIETAVSRSVARFHASGEQHKGQYYFAIGLSLSLALSTICMFVLRKAAPWASVTLLGEPRSAPLLSAMAYSFPFGAVHSSICGYYLGCRKTRVPASSQLLEQIARVSTVLILCRIYIVSHHTPPVLFAVFGLVFGEIVSSFYSVIYFLREHHSFLREHIAVRTGLPILRDLLRLSVPLTANRILLNVLQSVEAVSIPHCLKLYGCSAAHALSLYGVLMGMAMPCILFPSAATNSVATMLMPSVAELQASGNTARLRTLTSRVIAFCMLTGVLCGTIFLLIGNVIGTLLFHSPSAGKFIVTLSWICPFLYVNSSLVSILNGLGKTSSTLLINTAGFTVRILSIFLIIPFTGIIGYLWGMLASQILITLSCLTAFKKAL